MEEDIQTKLQQLLKHPAFLPSAIGAASFVVGAGVGYILGKRRREVVVVDTYDEPDFDIDVQSILNDGSLDEELEETDDEEDKEDEERAVLVVEEATEEVRPEGSFPEVAARFVEERIQRTIETRQGAPVEAVDHTIFADNGDDGWDYAVEVAKRTKTEPYVLHRDEFFEDEEGYSQITLTYYEGDDILVDEDDKPVYNYSTVTGPLLFGHGSGDPNVFYVRNDKRRSEYEILRHDGLYSREVLGLEIENNVRVRELKHSDHNRKFRLE